MNYILNKSIEEVVLKNINLVHFIVQRMKSNFKDNYEYDDVAQLGMVGLIKAAEKYNGTTKFSTYATRCILNEIYMFFRKNNKHLNVISYNEFVYEDKDGNQIQLADVIPSREIDILDRIIAKERLQICYSIILNCFSYYEASLLLYKVQGKNQTYIAEKFKITQCQVSRARKRVMRKLNKYAERKDKYSGPFEVNVKMDCCIISFDINDLEVLKDEMFNDLTASVSKLFKVERIKDKISIVIPDVTNSINVISILLETVNNHSVASDKNSRCITLN